MRADQPSSQGFATGFWHAGVAVSDMEAALAFYRDGLGLELESDVVIPGELVQRFVPGPVEEVRSVYLTIPGAEARLELHEYRGNDLSASPARPGTPGAGHFCLFVENVDAAYARLTAAGYGSLSPVVELTEAPFAGLKGVYVVDADGYPVELVERPATPS
jgi:catechol 2,3-dioxygenase-like lactoylglutathione lyase family enzyme